MKEQDLFGNTVEGAASKHAVIMMAIYLIENSEKLPLEDIYHDLAEKAIWQQSLESLSFVKEVFIESGLIRDEHDKISEEINSMIKRDSTIAYFYSESICRLPQAGEGIHSGTILYLSLASCLGHLISWNFLYFYSHAISKPLRPLYFTFIFAILLMSIPAFIIKGNDKFYWRHYELRGLAPKSVSRIDSILSKSKTA
ncbi:hypothetical protein K8B33_14485 [Alcanivorax sp. JB21]|uniref:hypothetical protein n=1 Tax=Alcanivorax limicola TaxID=2874102 RepID=UPI001CBCFF77|nr:hypothetical protein [Alcanivorax limicola]MBZ2190314.1 hypothetical protein [Alcanivorax limicola]